MTNNEPIQRSPKKRLIIMTCCLVAAAGLVYFGAGFVTKLLSSQIQKPQETKYWKFVNQVPIDLTYHFNNDGIATENDITDTNFDCPEYFPGLPGSGYPAEQLPEGGAIIHAQKIDGRFLFPPTNPRQLNNVSCTGQRLRVDHLMPSDITCAEVVILAAGDSKPVDATFILEYNDNRNDKVQVKVPAWDADQPGAVEAIATTTFRYVWDNAQRTTVKQEKACRIYALSIGANAGRRLTGVILPAQPDLRIFAVTLKLGNAHPDVAVRGDAAAINYKKIASLDKEPTAVAEQLQAAAEKLEEQKVSAGLERQLSWLKTQKQYVDATLGEKLVIRNSTEEENLADIVKNIEEDLKQLAAGKDPFTVRTGNIIKSYVSEIDGQTQSYSLFIPPAYEQGDKIPLVVALHSYRGDKLFQGTPSPALPREAIVLSPHGRGSIDYMFIAEEDILACINEVMKDYSIDPDRVYLVGSAMGGTGVWSIATKYPHMFAAVAPRSADGDASAWKPLGPNQSADRETYAAVRHFVRNSLDPVMYGMNLQNLPAFFTHGTEDMVIPVESSRSMVRSMDAAGVTYTYHEGRDGGNNWMPSHLEKECFDFLFSKTRDPKPKKITHRTAYLKYGKAYWLRIAQLEKMLEFGEIDAEVKGEELFIKTKNVSAIEIDVEKSPLGKKVTVKVNDAIAFSGSASGMLRLYKTGTVWSEVDKFPELMKRPYVEGPVSDVFTSPFVVVIGTLGDEADKAMIREEAGRFIAQWEAAYGAPPRYTDDTEITGKDIATYNLVLYGGPSHNMVSRRIANQLPISISNETIKIADRVYTGKSLAAKFCYPNPLNQEKMIAMIASAGSAENLFQSNNMFGNWLRWGGHDSRSWFDYMIFDNKTFSIETTLESGLFGNMWQVEPRTTWIGRDVDRASFKERKLPAVKQATSEAEEVLLSQVMPASIMQPKHTVGFDANSRGWQISLGSQATPFDHGIGIRPPTTLTYVLQNDATPATHKFNFFRATIGIDMDGETIAPVWREKNEWVKFLVYGDGRLLYQSPLVTWQTKPLDIEVPIEGVKVLELKVICSRAKWLVGSAAWANAKVTKK